VHVSARDNQERADQGQRHAEHLQDVIRSSPSKRDRPARRYRRHFPVVTQFHRRVGAQKEDTAFGYRGYFASDIWYWNWSKINPVE
jgi:hypothetical protein